VQSRSVYGDAQMRSDFVFFPNRLQFERLTRTT
jgi:hypothetical protein